MNDSVSKEDGGSHDVPTVEPPHFQVDMAVGRAAGAVEKCLKDGFFGLSADSGTLDPAEAEAARAASADPRENAARIKAAAAKFGAVLVGVCQTRQEWLYPEYRADGKQALPRELSRMVVMAVAMDREAIATSPARAASAATRIGYLKMAVCASAVGVFVRRCGYRAVAAGNGICLSVPAAVAAGLGEQGLHRMLVTAEFGACVRICKVFTDMPLAIGPSAALGVRAFCERCLRCVDACPSGAIPRDLPDASGAPEVDLEACRGFWRENGSSCSTCVAVCPFSAGAEGRR